MLFVLLCAALALLALAAVSLPLLSATGALPARGQYDRAVYRDQLREVERDVGRGVLSPDEAGAARLEIQRRLLAVDAGGSSGEWSRSPILAAILSLSFIVCAGGLYWRLGAPALPDVPAADRPKAPADAGPTVQGEAPPTHTDMAQAAERLEEKLKADPSNASGWVLYARTTSMLGDWAKAADAYKHAIELGQKDADTFAGYGEMQVMLADGIVSPAAHEAFAAALAADAGSGVARYYLALADSQAGEEHKAIDAWLALAAGLPEDSPMRDEIGHRIADAAKNGGFAAPPLPKGLPAEAASPGPNAEQMDAAASMTPEQRAQMIGGMVDKLAAQLQAQPNDLDGWMRLGQAYLVEGQGAKAVEAFDHAAALKPADSEIKLRIVSALLAGLKPADELPPRAVSLLNEVAATTPDAPEVLWYLGVVAAREGRAAEAREKWTKLLTSLTPGGEDDKLVRAALAELKDK